MIEPPMTALVVAVLALGLAMLLCSAGLLMYAIWTGGKRFRAARRTRQRGAVRD